MRVMAIDYGDQRIGLAVSDPTGLLCGEAWTMQEWNMERASQRIAEEAARREVGKLVLGLPKNMDGSEGPRAEKSRAFKALLEGRFPNSNVDVYAIENDFFGHSITVAGLVTGQDLIAQLKGKDLHGRLLIPSVMLRAEGDVFLDDVSVEDVERALGVRLVVVNNDGAQLLEAIVAGQ